MDKRTITTTITSILKDHFSEVLVETSTDNIIEAGMDSLKIIKLIIEIEEHFDFEFDDDDLTMTNFVSIDTIAELVTSKLNMDKSE